MYIIAGILGLEEIWYIGDEFCSRTYDAYKALAIKKEKKTHNWYAADNYEMCNFASTRYTSSCRNILARIKGLVVKAIDQQKYLPKALVFVVDDDIIRQANLPKDEVIDGEFQFIMKYLMEEIHRIVIGYKEKLPTKAKKDYLPHFIWIIPPVHKNFPNNSDREFFAEAIEKEVEKYPDMCGLKLKKIWDERDGNLFLKEQRRYTQEGSIEYWKSLDAAIKFWDKTLIDIMMKRQKKNPLQETACHQKFNVDRRPTKVKGQKSLHETNQRRSHSSRYVWHKESHSEIESGRKLPRPPRY